MNFRMIESGASCVQSILLIRYVIASYTFRVVCMYCAFWMTWVVFLGF